MIKNHWVQRGTLFSDTPTCLTPMSSMSCLTTVSRDRLQKLLFAPRHPGFQFCLSGVAATWWDHAGTTGILQVLASSVFWEKRKAKIATTSHKLMDLGYSLDSNWPNPSAPPSCLSLCQGDESPAGTNELGYPLGIEHGWEVSYMEISRENMENDQTKWRLQMQSGIATE